MLKWCTSASVYALGEAIGAHIRKEPVDAHRLGRTVVSGATADTVFLRFFHKMVDKKLPAPLLRVVAEQAIYAPCSNAAYLTLAKGSFSWEYKDWETLYVRDCTFWPFVSYIGYRFVPLRTRWLYVSFATLGWNTWRSTVVQN